MKFMPFPALAVVFCISSVSHAKEMFRFDLQSLAHLSTAVIEGNVTADEVVDYVDKLTLKVTHVYAGDIKEGQSVVVGLSAYSKVSEDPFAGYTRFGKGDHLILFIQPATNRDWKADNIPYWPVPSGLKLIDGANATGVQQMMNPGPYVNSVKEGNSGDLKEKVADAVKWAAQFKLDLEKNRKNAAWLLEQLKARPEIKRNAFGIRDEIAVTLCEAIAELGDPTTVTKAKEIRTDRYERQILEQPRAGK
jgi:hypothetical protein